MKALLLFSLSFILLMGIGCQGEQELNKAEKKEIIEELDSIGNQIVENCENANILEALVPYYNSPDFLCVTSEGIIQNYDEMKCPARLSGY